MISFNCYKESNKILILFRDVNITFDLKGKKESCVYHKKKISTLSINDILMHVVFFFRYTIFN